MYHFGPVLARELRQEEIERLDQDIRQWYDTVPAEVRVLNWVKEKRMTSTPSYNLQRLRIWTYLRFNQVCCAHVRPRNKLLTMVDEDMAVYADPT